MTKLEFTRRDVENLAEKLGSPQLGLSERERVLLLAIFSAASDRVRRADVEGYGKVELTLADLREQLVRAFIPGDSTDYSLEVLGIHPPP
jgi:hypothetical protein